MFVSAFWRGLGPALILVINPIIQYTAFEQLKNILVARRTSKLQAAGAVTAVAVLSDLDFFFLGAISKLGKFVWYCSKVLYLTLFFSEVATSITYPYMCVSILPLSTIKLTRSIYELSVVKSRLQAGAAHALKYKSSLDGLLTILREEGVGGLYKGIGSKIVQSVLTAAILFAGQRRIFEITKKVSRYFQLFLTDVSNIRILLGSPFVVE
jgi:solute carrier family 25 (peroxisomal adenine nucleotide transporter), member 17